MLYAIMCGGDYPEFKEPKQFTEVNGERLIDRTIRLLKDRGVFDICITSNNPAFDGLGVERITDPRNDYIHGTDKLWLNAFYPFHKEVCYLYGDVYYTEHAIQEITDCDRPGNILFGSKISMNKAGKNWGEPFAYIVRDFPKFWNAITKVIEMHYNGELVRHPITWEVYRYENGLDVNRQAINPDTFICIDDATIDYD